MTPKIITSHTVVRHTVNKVIVIYTLTHILYVQFTLYPLFCSLFFYITFTFTSLLRRNFPQTKQNKFISVQTFLRRIGSM
jgi:hypothetical protein